MCHSQLFCDHSWRLHVVGSCFFFPLAIVSDSNGQFTVFSMPLTIIKQSLFAVYVTLDLKSSTQSAFSFVESMRSAFQTDYWNPFVLSGFRFRVSTLKLSFGFLDGLETDVRLIYSTPDFVPGSFGYDTRFFNPLTRTMQPVMFQLPNAWTPAPGGGVVFRVNIIRPEKSKYLVNALFCRPPPVWMPRAIICLCSF